MGEAPVTERIAARLTPLQREWLLWMPEAEEARPADRRGVDVLRCLVAKGCVTWAGRSRGGRVAPARLVLTPAGRLVRERLLAPARRTA